ncbi:PD-(D/E)XK nuclease superfamily [Phytophthora infestans]|uniref:PD-(D/E)XK nuclease superfamily n=1 Tax=Phytophthora infestans TaxID=4787 RepID=A0A833WC32_PHYIN|nr:PD-(D/E)XK nuclease superfamily [Phytophthora infestans]
MNTRSKGHQQEKAAPGESLARGDNQKEHEQAHVSETNDAITEITEHLHKISFGEPRDATSTDLPKIATCSQLKEELPAVCNEVFRVLGSYNLEATYQRALARELKDRGVTVFSEVEIPVEYKGQRVATRRLDLYLKLDRPVILELKAVVTGLKTDHMKQLKFYMTHFNVNDGYLINFPHVTGFQTTTTARTMSSACCSRKEELESATESPDLPHLARMRSPASSMSTRRR